MADDNHNPNPGVSAGRFQDQFRRFALNTRGFRNELPPEITSALANLQPNPSAASSPFGRAIFNQIPLNQVVASTLVLPSPNADSTRTFLAVINTDAVDTLFIAFGQDASAVYWPINPNFGILGFDIKIPQNDIYMSATAANTTGVLLYCDEHNPIV